MITEELLDAFRRREPEGELAVWNEIERFTSRRALPPGVDCAKLSTQVWTRTYNGEREFPDIPLFYGYLNTTIHYRIQDMWKAAQAQTPVEPSELARLADARSLTQEESSDAPALTPTKLTTAQLQILIALALDIASPDQQRTLEADLIAFWSLEEWSFHETGEAPGSHDVRALSAAILKKASPKELHGPRFRAANNLRKALENRFGPECEGLRVAELIWPQQRNAAANP